MNKYTTVLLITLGYLLIYIWLRLDPWSCIISLVFAASVLIVSFDNK